MYLGVLLGLLLAGGVAAACLAWSGSTFDGADGETEGAPAAEAREKRAAARAATPEPTPAPPRAATAAVTEPGSPESAASRPRPIILRIESRPAGALLEDTASGAALGETPYELVTEVGAPRPRLRLTLKGYHPAEVSPPTERSDTAVVVLKPKTTPAKKDTAAPPSPIRVEP